MKEGRKHFLVATLLVTSLGLSTPSAAGRMTTGQPLTGVDTVLTTIATKSMISGSLAKDANGNLEMDPNGNFMFNYSGGVYRPKTNMNGELAALTGPIGTVTGQAAFPPAFAMLAINVYGWLMNGADPAQMPEIPSKIDWTMNDITIVVDGTTYRPIPDADMGLNARAFTGLGPVEIGQVWSGADGLSMSVRMGGCFAVAAEDGPHAGKIGTECLNGTFTFDLSGIDLSNPMASTLEGTGTSNCFTVIHEPMMP